jgi:ABC-2 type transport system ATP-binding protein
MAAEKTVILSTHILEEVEAICTRIIVITRGQVVVDDNPDSLRSRHGGARLDEIFRKLTQTDS